MNESESNPQTYAELSEQIDALRRQAFILLLALIIVSGTLVAYLFYQSRIMAKNVDNYKPQAMLVFQNYQQNLPAIQSFIKQLVDYGQTHPDFQQQILKRYQITPQTVAAFKK
jgi:predicted PurR-regulated permease PerM